MDNVINAVAAAIAAAIAATIAFTTPNRGDSPVRRKALKAWRQTARDYAVKVQVFDEEVPDLIVEGLYEWLTVGLYAPCEEGETTLVYSVADFSKDDPDAAVRIISTRIFVGDYEVATLVDSWEIGSESIRSISIFENHSYLGGNMPLMQGWEERPDEGGDEVDIYVHVPTGAWFVVEK